MLGNRNRKTRLNGLGVNIAAMEWSIFVLSAAASCFVVLLLAVIVMIFQYRKKLRQSNFPIDSQTIKLQECLPGDQKPYTERLVQYLLGYSEGNEPNSDGKQGSDAGFTKLIQVQPSSDSEYEYPSSTPPDEVSRSRTHSAGSKRSSLQIDSDAYRNRAYTDSPSPEGSSGIWRARESVFFKHARIRGEGLEEGELSEGRRSPLLGHDTKRILNQPALRKVSAPDRMSKPPFDKTRKVTGKPPLSPKIPKSLPATPSKVLVPSSKGRNPRRYSAAMVLERSPGNEFSELNRYSLGASLGSFENLTSDLGSLEISLYYSTEDKLLKVCVLDVNNPNEERSLVDSYIKVAFYLFEKPYKNEMELWSDSTKSLVKRTFYYLVTDVSELQKAVLRFTLRRKNSFVRRKDLGKAALKLCGKDVLEAQAYTLKLQHSVTELHGEVLVSICHQATSGILRVGIVRAMGLAKTMKKTMGAPFVIVELSSADEVLFVKSTKQKSNKVNPLFGETFDIPISTDSKTPLDDFHLQITVFRYTFSGSNDVVGIIRLETGSNSPNESEHWKNVTLNPHITVMKWHKLRIA